MKLKYSEKLNSGYHKQKGFALKVSLESDFRGKALFD